MPAPTTISPCVKTSSKSARPISARWPISVRRASRPPRGQAHVHHRHRGASSGGATESLQTIEVTSRRAAEEALRLHRDIFHARGLHSAWLGFIGIVVQPGVEFKHETVVDYVPEKVHDLCQLLHQAAGLVFEAHSTDYQRPGAPRLDPPSPLPCARRSSPSPLSRPRSPPLLTSQRHERRDAPRSRAMGGPLSRHGRAAAPAPPLQPERPHALLLEQAAR